MAIKQINFKHYFITFDTKTEKVYCNVKQIRFSLWSRNIFCPYCGIEMILPEVLNLKKGETMPDNTASLEHVYSRNNPERKIGFNRYEFIVCCFLCNNYKQMLETDKIPIEQLWEKSGRKPLYLR